MVVAGTRPDQSTGCLKGLPLIGHSGANRNEMLGQGTTHGLPEMARHYRLHRCHPLLMWFIAEGQEMPWGTGCRKACSQSLKCSLHVHMSSRKAQVYTGLREDLAHCLWVIQLKKNECLQFIEWKNEKRK